MLCGTTDTLRAQRRWLLPEGWWPGASCSNTASRTAGDLPQHLSEASRAHLAQHPGSRLLGKSPGMRKVWDQAWKSVLRSVLGPVMVTKVRHIPVVARQTHCDEAHLKSSEEVRPWICRQIKLVTHLQIYSFNPGKLLSFPHFLQAFDPYPRSSCLLTQSPALGTCASSQDSTNQHESVPICLQVANSSRRTRASGRSFWSSPQKICFGLSVITAQCKAHWSVNALVWDIIVNHSLWAVAKMTSDHWKLLFFFLFFFFP